MVISSPNSYSGNNLEVVKRNTANEIKVKRFMMIVILKGFKKTYSPAPILLEMLEYKYIILIQLIKEMLFGL